LVWIGTVVEVSMARQMRWPAALVVEVVLAVVIVVAVLLLQLETPLFTFLGGAEASLLFLLPMVTALAYGVVRSAKPTPRPETAHSCCATLQLQQTGARHRVEAAHLAEANG
jgi:hypothetical protein